MRLRGGFGTTCDAVYTGFVEIFHLGEWGAICDDDALAADVVCRQLGFPHGTPVRTRSVTGASIGDINNFSFLYTDYTSYDSVEEAEEPQERFWLSNVDCAGLEQELLACNVDPGFIDNNEGCSNPFRFTVACRMFPVAAALEDVSTPGAGA